MTYRIESQNNGKDGNFTVKYITDYIFPLSIQKLSVGRLNKPTKKANSRKRESKII